MPTRMTPAGRHVADPPALQQTTKRMEPLTGFSGLINISGDPDGSAGWRSYPCMPTPDGTLERVSVV